MKTIYTAIAAIMFAVASAGLASAADAKPDPRTKLETAIPYAIQLLEAGNHETFIRQFMPPDKFAKHTAQTPLNEIVAQFGQQKAPRLLVVLNVIKDLKPTMDDQGTKAAYELKEPANGKKSVIFVKIGDYWYIAN